MFTKHDRKIVINPEELPYNIVAPGVAFGRRQGKHNSGVTLTKTSHPVKWQVCFRENSTNPALSLAWKSSSNFRTKRFPSLVIFVP
jgi:hypothetical protein